MYSETPYWPTDRHELVIESASAHMYKTTDFSYDINSYYYMSSYIDSIIGWFKRYIFILSYIDTLYFHTIIYSYDFWFIWFLIHTTYDSYDVTIEISIGPGIGYINAPKSESMWYSVSVWYSVYVWYSVSVWYSVYYVWNSMCDAVCMSDTV